jgi:CheY-like chemotaxis protein
VLHGGTIVARSEGKGHGATFEILLPSVARSLPGPAALDADPRPVQPIDAALLHDRRVLVVDDQEDARTLMEAALRHYGAEVTTAANVDEALDAVERVRPDVILSDIGMPHADGYALIHRLRARPPAEGGAVPAIAVTAYATPADRAAAQAAGFQAHVAKPFEPAEVARLVAELTPRGADAAPPGSNS